MLPISAILRRGRDQLIRKQVASGNSVRKAVMSLVNSAIPNNRPAASVGHNAIDLVLSGLIRWECGRFLTRNSATTLRRLACGLHNTLGMRSSLMDAMMIQYPAST